MEYPRVIRCSAAFGTAAWGSAVAGVMTIAVIVGMSVRKPGADNPGVVLHGVLLLLIAGTFAIVSVLALQCRIIVDREEITFIRRLGRRRTFQWDQIWGFEAVNEWKHSQGHVIGLDGQRFRPAALRCYRFGSHAPASLRYVCDLLNYELHLRRTGSAASWDAPRTR